MPDFREDDSDPRDPSADLLRQLDGRPDLILLATLFGGRGRLGSWARAHPVLAEEASWWLSEAARPAAEGEPDSITARLVRRVLPPNWSKLSHAFIPRLQTYVRETGLCLSWVPDPDTIRALYRAGVDPADRDAALVANADAIIASCSECMPTLTAPELGPLPQACAEAVDAVASGYLRAGQALAAAALTEVLEVHIGVPGKGFGEYRRRFEAEAPTPGRLRDLRRAEVQWALRHAILRAEPGPGADGFNRHLTAHGVNDKQYTWANALSAVLLITGSVAESNAIYQSGSRYELTRAFDT